MTEKYWSEKESEQEFDPIGSLLSEWSDPEEEEEEFRSDFFQGLDGRRKKAAFVLMAIWGIVLTLHLVSWGYLIVFILTGLVGIHAFRLSIAQPELPPVSLSDRDLASAPKVSLLVAAKNEAAVIGNLIEQLCNLDYPRDQYEVWAIDDHSSDRTPEILDRLAQKYPQLKVVHRPANAGGGKSGALNQVLSQTQGEIVGVFDADAGVTPDLLRRVVPMFASAETGAVQVRKAIANTEENFWTKGQAAEMALDSYMQQQRIALGGIGELRGNGQFVRRSALERCGRWNEETITDDLDLTIRLHLDNWKIGFLLYPSVQEEGVVKASSLWHQRNRWAEGGYQRYLDYWRYLFRSPMGLRKRFDLLTFILLQYILPTACVPDLIMGTIRHHFILLSPLSALLFFFAYIGMFRGILRTRAKQQLNLFDLINIGWQSLNGLVYMLHWQVVMPCITARMSIRPKRLKWVKTVHEGAGTESFDY
ncbi:glycosyl transferase family 2 [Stanieria cyanosphaera PCC 7437]|uniref:Beta-monoglucosyldiacylglycerol synthase n=1 Tax=Stanieria cyanosphaera (strain ATCC 29371 / PCC 7437) TaxID=111780 RepID=K9XYC1_STAC7|nr:glycosyltransferase family 2 protein [Stanieria cyanosphaera]AFZ37106.1 glycosyl transferase family 2 [Stanieria cyanosphaera PCC 7437]